MALRQKRPSPMEPRPAPRPARGSLPRSREHAVGTGPAIPRSISERNSNLDFYKHMKTNSLPSSSTDRAIESFQQTMQAFLEVQKATMLAYLAGRAGPGFSGPPVHETEIEERGKEPASAAFVAPSRTRNGRDAATRRNGHLEDHESSTRIGTPRSYGGRVGDRPGAHGTGRCILKIVT